MFSRSLITKEKHLTPREKERLSVLVSHNFDYVSAYNFMNEDKVSTCTQRKHSFFYSAFNKNKREAIEYCDELNRRLYSNLFISRESLARELWNISLLAKKNEDYKSAISAITNLAKMHGFMIDRSQIELVGPIEIKYEVPDNDQIIILKNEDPMI